MKGVAKDHSKKGHVVLLGDSILDNKPYVGNDPCVIEQIQAEVGSDGQGKQIDAIPCLAENKDCLQLVL